MKILKTLTLMIAISFLTIACGSGGGGGGGGTSAGDVAVEEYAGHYDGTVRYAFDGYQPLVLTVEFDINQQGELTSFIIDGVVIDLDEVESTITAGSAIEINGVIRGQGSFIDPDFGSITFTFTGVFDVDSGQGSIIYTYSGGLTGTAELIVTRT